MKYLNQIHIVIKDHTIYHNISAYDHIRYDKYEKKKIIVINDAIFNQAINQKTRPKGSITREEGPLNFVKFFHSPDQMDFVILE